MNRNRWGRYATAIAASVSLSVAACSAGETPALPTTPSSSQPSVPRSAGAMTTSPADTAKQQSTAAYLGMWRDMAEAATTSDWRSPKLARNATGEALRTISRSLYADHYNGLITKGRPVNYPEVTAVEPKNRPTSVTITDCGDSTNWRKYHADSGKPANDGPGGHRRIEALVKKAADGSWKVTTFAVHEVGSCAG